MGQHTERVYYIKDSSTGKIVYCGKCVNYPSVNATGVALKELENSIIEQLEIERDLLSEIIELPGSLEMVEKDSDADWLWSNVNIAYWEIERLKYLLSKDSEYRDILLKIMTDAVQECNEDSEHSMYIAAKVVKAIIEYKNK